MPTEQAIAGHEVIDVEARYLNRDGRWRHLLTRRVAERDDSGRVVALAGMSLDQTARIEERERAQALAQRIQLVADASGVGVWTIDNPGEGEAERVEWNAQMFRIYGLPEDQPAPPLAEWMGSRVHVQDRAARGRRAAARAPVRARRFRDRLSHRPARRHAALGGVPQPPRPARRPHACCTASTST